MSFESFGFDERLLTSIGRQAWSSPTAVQTAMFPLMFKKRNIISKARTGSGKTAAYALPILQMNITNSNNKAIILVPSKELCQQVFKMVQNLGSTCLVQVKEISAVSSKDEQPDILIGTPTKLLANISLINIDAYKSIIIDEADLIATFGHSNALLKLVDEHQISQNRQFVLTSATLDVEDDEVQTLRETLKIEDPVLIALQSLPSKERLKQFTVGCNEIDDKFLLLLALLKLRLLTGKSLIFSNSVDSCYKIRLFLEQFGLKSVVLNSDMPHKSRLHTLAQFNKGIYDTMIASDENHVISDEKESKTAKKGKKNLKEYSVSRGVDFNEVNNVLNFDLPSTAQQYIHRVGRTARGECSTGIALSFLQSESDFELVKLIQKKCQDLTEPFAFKIEQVQNLRYRCGDALRAITKAAVRDARIKELKAEILNSKNLKEYFEENPKDLQLLRHDKALSKISQRMVHLPDYLIPDSLKIYLGASVKTGQKRKVQGGQKPPKKAKKDQKKQFIKMSRKERREAKRKNDPLGF